MDPKNPTEAASPDTAYRMSPQLEQIRQLEKELRQSEEGYENALRLVDEFKEKLRASEAARYALWPTRWLKSLLKFVLILLWFGLVLVMICGPVWAIWKSVHEPHWMNQDSVAGITIFMWLSGVILGFLFWGYIHSKSED